MSAEKKSRWALVILGFGYPLGAILVWAGSDYWGLSGAAFWILIAIAPVIAAVFFGSILAIAIFGFHALEKWGKCVDNLSEKQSEAKASGDTKRYYLYGILIAILVIPFLLFLVLYGGRE